ncbi:MAG: hypothetical protein Q9200_007339, partial [Gallowayella weberi]
FYAIIVAFIKVAILLQCLRIFVPHRRGNLPLFVSIHVLMWCNVMFYIFHVIFMTIMCLPREKIWNKLEPEGHCFNTYAASIASGIFNVLSDFAILILPMSEIGDFSYNITIMGIWTWAEITAGILVSCLPVMPRFFQHIGPKVYASFKSNSIIRSLFSITPRRTSTGIKNDHEINDSSGRPLKGHSFENVTFDGWDQSVVQTSVRGGQKNGSQELGTSQSDIRVERSFMVEEGPPNSQEDVETGRYTF